MHPIRFSVVPFRRLFAGTRFQISKCLPQFSGCCFHSNDFYAGLGCQSRAGQGRQTDLEQEAKGARRDLEFSRKITCVSLSMGITAMLVVFAASLYQWSMMVLVYDGIGL